MASKLPKMLHDVITVLDFTETDRNYVDRSIDDLGMAFHSFTEEIITWSKDYFSSKLHCCNWLLWNLSRLVDCLMSPIVDN